MTAPVLVLNGGSSSLKSQLLEPTSGQVLARGLVERIGSDSAVVHAARPDATGNAVGQWEGPIADHGAALAQLTAELAALGVELSGDRLLAVGHRVVHGGIRFRQPTIITDVVVDAIDDLAALAPLHNPGNAALIRAATQHFPHTPQVAVFDTAFFADLPEVATTYAIDRAVARQYSVRRFGFHGISHAAVSAQTAALMGADPTTVNQIVLHLGNGASISAIQGGKPRDTSMGLTPLEGLVMGSRGGDIDPGALIHLMREADYGADDLANLLNHRSGLQGLTGQRDLRDVAQRAEAGDPDARSALELYCYRSRKYIGSYLAVLGRVDAIVFTAGVGENAAAIRAEIVAGLDGLGISIDPARNTADIAGPRLISPPHAQVAVAVIPTNEELAIARAAAALLKNE